ncbi:MULTISPECIES: ATP-dependent DNA helicase [unclassified Pseudoclavibacter]|uniref:ATP-dependent DNA helicase n=1 Tax=unclassified Pseudoclavibacter TaxID=2615177 RepID=UPI000CE8FAC3|nr:MULTISPECIES: AAA family ATPase [unclassified Pseudoclavibacter]MBS3179247.1 AAA family ATPase [Pseudoclavibacter sp. Marseille-Q4354]NYF12033.1 ATP-dependent exoDNAse (exonuclease V) alpha subunit [Pseudoclavibacter sp. JAI123]PPG27130.1 helicase [Pseudoclavibacter sp. RFBB5]
MTIVLTPEQQGVFDAIEHTRDHLFVTGRAGTGKSTLLNHLAWHTSKQLVIAAPTGVAALNVGGQTIHSLFKLPIGVIGDAPIEQNGDVRKLLNKIDTLVIDEVSMVSADLMDAIDRSLRQARQRKNEAFGGVQLVMFGDPFQLAPVPPSDPDERAYFRDHYRSLWFFDAKVWQEAELRIHALREIHRQHEDEFKNILTAVRYGQVTADMANRLNTVGARPAPADGTITLASRNAQVSRINAQNLERLPGASMTANADISGEFGGRNFPADERLDLKVGAQVMFLRNDSDGRWVNGSIGEVTRIDKTVYVEIDGDEHEVEPLVWEKLKYSYSPDTRELSRDVVGEFTQFPLRLAWAVTIHKSQGKTYDRAVVDLGARAFSPGQTYVALSRIRALDGLHLSRPLQPNDIFVDDNVLRFMKSVSAAAKQQQA